VTEFVRGPWTPWRGLEVEVEVVLLGEADEGPVVEEASVVDVAEVVQDHPAGRAEAGRQLVLRRSTSS
jgi:hypothetical protein